MINKLLLRFVLLLIKFFLGLSLYAQKNVDGLDSNPYLLRDVFNTKKTNIIESNIMFSFKNGNSQLETFSFSFYRLTNRENNKWHKGLGIGIGYNPLIKINHINDKPNNLYELIHGEYFVSYFPSKYLSFDLGVRGVAYFSDELSDEFNENGWSIAPGIYAKVETGLTKLRIGTTITGALIFYKGGSYIISDPGSYFLFYLTPAYIRYYFSK
jgi:hypothetical protein